MQRIIDFLSFKIFISPSVLIICYFIGAFIIPIASFFFVKWLQRKYRPVLDPVLNAVSVTKDVLSELKFKPFIKLKHRILFISVLIFLFISLEIMWRMLFEFLIAYLQIREALMGSH